MFTPGQITLIKKPFVCQYYSESTVLLLNLSTTSKFACSNPTSVTCAGHRWVCEEMDARVLLRQ